MRCEADSGLLAEAVQNLGSVRQYLILSTSHAIYSDLRARSGFMVEKEGSWLSKENESDHREKGKQIMYNYGQLRRL